MGVGVWFTLVGVACFVLLHLPIALQRHRAGRGPTCVTWQTPCTGGPSGNGRDGGGKDLARMRAVLGPVAFELEPGRRPKKSKAPSFCCAAPERQDALFRLLLHAFRAALRTHRARFASAHVVFFLQLVCVTESDTESVTLHAAARRLAVVWPERAGPARAADFACAARSFLSQMFRTAGARTDIWRWTGECPLSKAFH